MTTLAEIEMRERHPLAVKLKSGEYDGKDVMEAWLLIERLSTEHSKALKLLADIKTDLDMRAEMNDWAKIEDPEFFFSTLGHTEEGGFVVALGSTNYWRLCESVSGTQT